MRRLFLASLSLDGLPEFLGGARGRRAAWVPTAADPLEDRERVRALFAGMLESIGLSLLPVELDRDADPTIAVRLAASDLVIVTGGDPFHLLARARASGFDRALQTRADLPYVGVSAGAILVGPSLEPHVLTSPFAPAKGQPLEGLGLTEHVVLPHHDREERALLHDVAKQKHGARWTLTPLRDDEALIVDGDGRSHIVTSR
ncbi:Type 1 glutamine amidotransferase-like domain-containing protein [Sandaracinus amylolyticus]|uniref:Alpha-aspartyl dipeptidase Peptidase E n=1 Tax=Sandaracinus amylolyticus TaxID=927083 RepID=A0A0F6W8S9_9BACT|nr:Type 1 glutamine amidotransferase-like domain-containing protein [Sandaracinus amylolyticus]AKF10246.1 Alpha-aspartyl dipeptidase Peptidase E [Sandaracinus amylolyticus]